MHAWKAMPRETWGLGGRQGFFSLLSRPIHGVWKGDTLASFDPFVQAWPGARVGGQRRALVDKGRPRRPEDGAARLSAHLYVFIHLDGPCWPLFTWPIGGATVHRQAPLHLGSQTHTLIFRICTGLGPALVVRDKWCAWTCSVETFYPTSRVLWVTVGLGRKTFRQIHLTLNHQQNW